MSRFFAVEMGRSWRVKKFAAGDKNLFAEVVEAVEWRPSVRSRTCGESFGPMGRAPREHLSNCPLFSRLGLMYTLRVTSTQVTPD